MKYRIDGPMPVTVTATESGADVDITRHLRALLLAVFAAADNDPEGLGEEFADMHALAVSAQHQGRDSHARHEFDERMDHYLREFVGEPVVELSGAGVREMRDACEEIAAPRSVPGQRSGGAAA